MNRLLTTQEAAARLGMPLRTVQNMATRGDIRAQKYGNVWLIRERDLASIERRPVGRPKKGEGRDGE